MTPGEAPVLLNHPACARHHAPGHPERPERIEAIEAALGADVELRNLPRHVPERVSRERLESIHRPAFVEAIHRAGAEADERGEGTWIDPDTWLGRGSLEAALVAAGAGVTAIEIVLTGESRAAFSLCRPPGHHATRAHAMGFCLFNNVAVAAQEALDRGLERVAIVDFDVHHGNGTEDIFYERSDVLYLSCHQSPLYPGTGATEDRGRGEGEGYTVNFPMPPGCGDDEYLSVFDLVFGPALREYRPELLLLSAGFDAHQRDALAQMEVTSAGYGRMGARIQGWADELCGGRSAWFLEGGYDLEGLSSGAVAVVTELRATG
jgi:acetoin utilization deacetylase AcuC-like enzyme